MNIKMKVSENFKGKLSISDLNRTFKAGDEIEFTKEQLETVEIYNIISTGFIEFLNKKDESKVKPLVKYKNLTKTILNFSFGSSIKPSQTFFLSLKNTESKEVKDFIKEGKIGVVKEDENKSKTIKRVGAETKTLKNKPYVVNHNEESTKKEIPKGMYVHDPKKGQQKESSIEQQLAELDERNSDGMEFVDLKQAKERLLKTQKSIKAK